MCLAVECDKKMNVDTLKSRAYIKQLKIFNFARNRLNSKPAIMWFYPFVNS